MKIPRFPKIPNSWEWKSSGQKFNDRSLRLSRRGQKFFYEQKLCNFDDRKILLGDFSVNSQRRRIIEVLRFKSENVHRTRRDLKRRRSSLIFSKHKLLTPRINFEPQMDCFWKVFKTCARWKQTTIFENKIQKNKKVHL